MTPLDNWWMSIPEEYRTELREIAAKMKTELFTFKDYERENKRTDRNYEIPYYYLGLAGETGEVIEIFKKAFRRFTWASEAGTLTMEEKEHLFYELGDVLWYITAIARHNGMSLESIAEKNIEKLDKREQNR